MNGSEERPATGSGEWAAPRRNNGGAWIRRNIPAVVTWALIVVAFATIWGAQGQEVASLAETAKENKAAGLAATVERGEIRSDVRVLRDGHERLDKRVSKGEEIMSRQEKAVSRLEVLVERMERRDRHRRTP